MVPLDRDSRAKLARSAPARPSSAARHFPRVDFPVRRLTGAQSSTRSSSGRLSPLVAIVFSGTGLLVGCFLPSDSLLITAGLVAAGGP
jgi:hypothetical protein